ncbi:Hint domain-containing protein [Roseovarius sp. CAU 1744]|uniref:Hint domain-containing protein n=1 Tax=Roseovarius sp. CAU 1744 TaxID=3140368 RepID=UPI00325B4830
MATKVVSSMGLRKVEALTEGDKVLTFDAGMQAISKITRQNLWQGEGPCPQRFWPLEVAAGALGNRDVMLLLPHQSVMIESDAAEEVYGDPFTLIPAVALEGVNGIRRIEPVDDFEVFTLQFETDQVVFGNSGALFFCPAARDLLAHAFEPVEQTSYTVRPLREARVLARELQGAKAAICDVSPCESMVAA